MAADQVDGAEFKAFYQLDPNIGLVEVWRRHSDKRPVNGLVREFSRATGQINDRYVVIGARERDCGHYGQVLFWVELVRALWAIGIGYNNGVDIILGD